MTSKEQLFFDPYPLCFTIPEVEELSYSVIPRLWFVKHVTMNSQALTKETYELNLNSDNYRSYIYAFAYEIGVTDPSDPASWQLEVNASMLKEFLRKKSIHLSYAEEDVLNISLYFTTWWLSKELRQERSELLMQNLRHEYGLGK